MYINQKLFCNETNVHLLLFCDFDRGECVVIFYEILVCMSAYLYCYCQSLNRYDYEKVAIKTV